MEQTQELQQLAELDTEGLAGIALTPAQQVRNLPASFLELARRDDLTLDERAQLMAVVRWLVHQLSCVANEYLGPELAEAIKSEPGRQYVAPGQVLIKANPPSNRYDYDDHAIWLAIQTQALDDVPRADDNGEPLEAADAALAAVVAMQRLMLSCASITWKRTGLDRDLRGRLDLDEATIGKVRGKQYVGVQWKGDRL